MLQKNYYNYLDSNNDTLFFIYFGIRVVGMIAPTLKKKNYIKYLRVFSIMRVETFAQAGLERLHFDHLFIQDIFCILEFIKVTFEVIQSLNNKINRNKALI